MNERLTESAESLKQKGNAALQNGNLGEAEACYRGAIAADPGYMPAYYNLGNVLVMQRRHEEALAAYQKAGELDPQDYEILVNIGATLNTMGRYDEAITALNKAEQLMPTALEPKLNRGVALTRSGRHEAAIAEYDRILKADRGCSIARYYRSMEYLLLGRWQEGFLDHESRLDLPGYAFDEMFADKPEWDGSDLTGQTLLIYPEQGVGDMIHFLRYAKACKARGARVMVCCHPPLASLLKTAEDIDVVVPDGQALPEPYDVYISVMSLPYVLGRMPELPPLKLNIPPRQHSVIAQATGMKIGFCWQGNPDYGRNAERSIQERELWDNLGVINNTSFFSLQIGIEQSGHAIPLSPYINDFLDTASLVQQLDRVVTVDTSVAHLCGSLGAPTCLLLAYSPDWRWGIQGDATPWYPSMRVFRQVKPWSWAEPLAKVRQYLQQEAGKRTP
ncbi:MAG: tetratricopeptide repeat-containing glycosyltransferase family protein [Gallionellaceae bacterium]|nr:tetratricopeptide repeat-containing glycosyltransferase family protein [Gallionellaceae bacterium]